jgi:hypothetical protein
LDLPCLSRRLGCSQAANAPQNEHQPHPHLPEKEHSHQHSQHPKRAHTSHKQPHHPYSLNFHHNQNKNPTIKLNPPTNQQEPYYAKTPNSRRLPLNYLKGKIKPKTTKQTKQKPKNRKRREFAGEIASNNAKNLFLSIFTFSLAVYTRTYFRLLKCFRLFLQNLFTL